MKKRGRVAKPKTGASRGGRPLYGLRPSAFPKSVRDRVDQDYAHRLTPEEQKWLSDFNEFYYRADFDAALHDDVSQDWSTEERRAAYRAKNSANRDVYGAASNTGAMDYLDTTDAFETRQAVHNRVRAVGHLNAVLEAARAPPPDPSPTPAYLESPTYKAALAWWRQHVDNGTTDTPEGLAARRLYERMIDAEEAEQD